MLKRTILPRLTLVALAAVTFACSFERHSTGVSPSSITTGGGGSTGSSTGSSSMVGAWWSQSVASLPSVASCGNFQWQVTSQAANSVSGTFSALCAGSLTVSGMASGQLNGTSVAVTVSGSASGPTLPSCGFTVSGIGTITNGDTLTIPYTGTTCLGPVHGTETLHHNTSPASPPPAPPPPPPSPPATTAAAVGRTE